MPLKTETLIKIIVAVLVIVFLVYDIIALYTNTFWRPFLFLEIALLIVGAIWGYDNP
jgi:hypothetical protein